MGKTERSGAKLLVECLINHGVSQIYGIPGAKIDGLFDALVDSPIEVIVCRHEQNAAMMAAAHGRLTGEPGVVLVTSGPGVANLVTGLLTATTEGDPVIAIGGNVAREMKLKESHQCADNAALLQPATKYSVEIPMPATIPEIVNNAFRHATTPRCGAAFISVPQDILTSTTDVLPLKPAVPVTHVASDTAIDGLVQLLTQAKCPVLLLGEESSRPDACAAIRELLSHFAIPTVNTYQAAGVVSRELVDNFVGRVGLFKNQPGDKLLAQSDLVITVGYNPTEYDPELWHVNSEQPIVHIDYNPCQIRLNYLPVIECVGNIAATITAIKSKLPARDLGSLEKIVAPLREHILERVAQGKDFTSMPLHPLRFIHELTNAIDDEALVISDVGSHYMWLARYCWRYQPRRLLFSNGQQTLGVALPWALGAAIAMPDKQIVSVSGDGGFLFSAVELETAVRKKANFIHFIWCDGSYNMVREQQLLKYGRDAAVEFGEVDFVKFAQSFGARGHLLQSPEQVSELIAAEQNKGPVIVAVPIDYSDNAEMFKMIHSDVGN